MTKERLQELIKQRATVYNTSWKETVRLGENCKISGDYLFVYEDAEHSPTYDIEYLVEGDEIELEIFKDKYWTAREEQFEPPYWDDIDKESNIQVYYTFSVPQLHCPAKICKISSCVFVEWGINGQYAHTKDFGVLTEKNYEKAVDFARKLFLGEIENVKD